MLIVPDTDTYVLRTCDAQMRAYGGFLWPVSGVTYAPDWKADANCGHGLHGLLWGEGDGNLVSWEPDAKWLVVKIIGGYIELKGKVKFESGEVVFVGDRASAITEIVRLGATGAVVGATVCRDGNGVAASGYRGTATAGEGGTATAGYRGTATAGYRGTATAGEGGTATAGEGGTATAGYRGTATAGNYGTATAGEGGTATAGYRGTATAGEGGTATAGEGGTIILRWYDAAKGRYRITEGYVGEDGIEADTKYRATVDGRLEKVL